MSIVNLTSLFWGAQRYSAIAHSSRVMSQLEDLYFVDDKAPFTKELLWLEDLYFVDDKAPFTKELL